MQSASVVEGKGIGAASFESAKDAEKALAAVEKGSFSEFGQVVARQPTQSLELPLTTLWVGGIPGNCTGAHLLAGFCRFGRVLNSTIGGRPGKTGDQSGFVRFASRAEAETALAAAAAGDIAFDGSTEGRAVKCQWARTNCLVPGIDSYICLSRLPPRTHGDDLVTKLGGPNMGAQSAAVVAGIAVVSFRSREDAATALTALQGGAIEEPSRLAAWRPQDGCDNTQ